MIKGFLGLCWLIVLPSVSYAESSKPFHLLPFLDAPKDLGNQNEQGCLIQQNFNVYMDYAVSTVLPRADKEVNELIQPQTVDGKTIHVAHYTDYTDLFHLHIRYPNRLQVTNFDELMDSQKYHLHYHSFEHLTMIYLKWLNQLRYMDNGTYEAWIKARIEKWTVTSDGGGAMGGPHIVKPDIVKQTMLDDEGVAHLANRWHQALSQSPGLDQISLWVRVLNNPLDTKSVGELLRYRSVASYNDRYDIAMGIDLPNEWQPIDIFFVEVRDNKVMAKEISDYMKRNNVKWLANYEGNMQPFIAVRENVRADGIATYNKVLQMIEAHSDTNFTFKETVLRSKSFTTALTVSGGRIYALKSNVYRFDCH